MAYHPAPVVLLSRERTGRDAPDGPVVLVAQVDGLTRRVRDGIVGERRQPIFATVSSPCEGGARAGHDGPEFRIRQHIRPWHGGFAVAVEHDHVFAAIWSEAADAVLQDASLHLQGAGRVRGIAMGM